MREFNLNELSLWCTTIKASSGSSVNPFQYVGRPGYYSNRDLLQYSLLARVYEPATARFPSPDPLRLAGGDANLYRYVRNTPTNVADPSGLLAPFLFPVATSDLLRPLWPHQWAPSPRLLPVWLPANWIAAATLGIEEGHAVYPKGTTELLTPSPIRGPSASLNWYMFSARFILRSVTPTDNITQHHHNSLLGKLVPSVPSRSAATRGSNQCICGTPRNAITFASLAISLPDMLGSICLYGRYCGPCNGPGDPIDCVDRACQAHDTCLATVWDWINLFHKQRCQREFCFSLNKCLFSGEFILSNLPVVELMREYACSDWLGTPIPAL
jgi:RHS repeat-associated protein